MKQIKIAFSALLLMVLAACSTVPLTGRKKLDLVSEASIQEQAVQAYRQFLGDPGTKVIASGADAQRIKTVGGRIAAAISSFMQSNGYGNQYNYNWEFNLIQSKEVNAWCMPGGKVAVYSGILPVTLNDAGLATVLGHEIAHAIAGHSAERASQTALANAGGGIIGATTGSQTLTQLYGLGGQLALLRYSRGQESEADRLGLIFMALAGYDPNTAVSFWQRMAASSNGGAPPEFLSTHPSDATRIADIQKRLPEAMKYYKR
jgi:predicted Zn-dependent protease